MKKIILAIIITIISFSFVNATSEYVEIKEGNIIKKYKNYCERGVPPYHLGDNTILTKNDQKLFNLDNGKFFTKLNLVLSKIDNKINSFNNYKQKVFLSNIITKLEKIKSYKKDKRILLIINVLIDRLKFKISNIEIGQSCKSNIIEFGNGIKSVRSGFTYKLLYNGITIDEGYDEYLLSQIKKGKSGIYFINNQKGGFNNLMFYNKGEYKTLYKSENVNFILKDYELLLNKKIKLIFKNNVEKIINLNMR